MSRLRADAERNRQKILEAARTAFAEGGLGVTLDAIAARAGVGVGTVYRRFPDKEALIGALFEERIEEMVGYAEAGLADPDPWEGLAGLMHNILEMHSRDRGIKDIMFASEYGPSRAREIRGRMAPLVGELVTRAKAEGKLREDAVFHDIPLIQLMLATIIEATAEIDTGAWRRFLAIVLDGLRAQGEPLPPALDLEQFLTVMENFKGWRR